MPAFSEKAVIQLQCVHTVALIALKCEKISPIQARGVRELLVRSVGHGVVVATIEKILPVGGGGAERGKVSRLPALPHSEHMRGSCGFVSSTSNRFLYFSNEYFVVASLNADLLRVWSYMAEPAIFSSRTRSHVGLSDSDDATRDREFSVCFREDLRSPPPLQGSPAVGDNLIRATPRCSSSAALATFRRQICGRRA
jgi:hypothetical protein